MSGVPKPSGEEVSAAARTLEASYDPETGRLPAELFFATSATVPRDTVELAIFDVTKQEVLLTKREDGDPYFANKWHLPGVMMVPVDVEGPFPDAKDNAAIRARDELEGTRITSLVRLSPHYIDPPARRGPRGVEIPTLYGATLIPEEPNVGRMFKVDDLPDPLYEHHIPLIPACRDALHNAMASLPIITLAPSQNFVERQRAQAVALQERSVHYEEASELATTLWEGYDEEDLRRKAETYHDTTGQDFRKLHSGTGGAFTPNSFQYPFVEVSPGLKMTFREITAGERFRGGPNQNGGDITSVTLVVQVEDQPGDERYSYTDPNADDPGEITYATVFDVEHTAHGVIGYADPAAQENPVLGATADRELLGHIRAVREGLRKLLDHPEQAVQ